MKKYKTPRTIREMQIKTTMKYHLTECPSLKSLQITNAGENIEKRQQSYTAGGNLIDIAAGENEQPHYFVNFNFDADNTFRNVYVQANVFTDNATTKTESIVSLDPETVNAEIQKEYRRAIG